LISRSTVARICAELHERFEAFKRRSLYDTDLVVLFLDAIFLPVRLGDGYPRGALRREPGGIKPPDR
jgi:transposase-like protein